MLVSKLGCIAVHTFSFLVYSWTVIWAFWFGPARIFILLEYTPYPDHRACTYQKPLAQIGIGIGGSQR